MASPVIVLTAVLIVGAASGATTGGPENFGATRTAVPPPAATYEVPVAGPVMVLRKFEPPATKYGAGHLGVDLAAKTGTPVLAAGDGTVRFAGSVAGRGVLVITHPDGVTTEYEPVHPVVRTGAQVRLGQHVADVAGDHRGCAPGACLHWGARVADDYLDPLSLLNPLGVVRLLPWNAPG